MPMSIEDELNAALVDAYRRSGEEVGYWGVEFSGPTSPA